MKTSVTASVATALAAAISMLPGVVAADTSVTIYSRAQPGAVAPEMYRPVAGRTAWQGHAVPGYAVVRTDRQIALTRGRSEVSFTDVAALLDPTTVQFTSLTDPAGTRVLEQDFRFDLVGTERLLERYIDRKITVRLEPGRDGASVTGTLLSTTGGIVLSNADSGLHVIKDYDQIDFPSLPGGLMTRPTLIWDVDAGRSGEHNARISYQTTGITWWADYNLVWAEGENANSGTLDVAAWVSIINQSGATYEDAQLKLIAGDVQRAESPAQPRRMQRMALDEVRSGGAGFEEKAFFEFHLYTLGRKTTLPDRSTKQLELFPAATGVPANKKLIYSGATDLYASYGQPQTDRNFRSESNPKVDVYLEFENRKKGGLGLPLPAGRLRVSELDSADGSLEFIGEDIIDHTPRNQPVRIRLGSSFDVVGERKQKNFSVDTKARWMEEEIEVSVTNRKEESVDVLVKEHLYRWTNWTVTEKSDKFDKADSRTIEFPLRIAADTQKTVRYVVRYTW